jgi:Ni/Co efflux regulator RcnB
MKVRKGLAVIATGTILAAAGAAYSAPLQQGYYRDNDRQVRIAESQKERGERLIRRGRQLERMGNWRQGEELERQGRQLVREAQRHERYGLSEERHER